MISPDKKRNSCSDRRGIFDFLDELRRRRVYRAAAVYAVSMWLVCQVVELIYRPLGLPAWTLTLLIIIGLVGFPIALVVSWLFDITLRSQHSNSERNGVCAHQNARPRSVWEKAIDSCLILSALAISVQLALNGLITEPEVAQALAPRIAVIPFRTAYGNNAGIFSDGLLAELQHELTNVPGLTVIAPTEQHTTIDTLSLTGCVSIDDDGIRVTATIIDNNSGVITWSGVFEKPRRDSVYAPVDFAQEIVAELPLATVVSGAGRPKNAG